LDEHKDAPVKVLTTFCISSLISLATILVLMLISSYFDPHAFKPVIALGIATGIGLARAVSSWKELSRDISAVVTGFLVGLCYFLAALLNGG
jgi:hypothetical protein